MKPGAIAVLLVLLLAVSAATGDRADNSVYVQSGPDNMRSPFYARCTPAAREGTAGRTEIFRVRETGDEPLDRYDFYAPAGVVLGWSPIKGKVAVLAVMREGRVADWKNREELRFSLGGVQLASYTSAQLLAMGAQQQADSVSGLHAAYRVAGCEQVPGTNHYDFVLEIAEGKTLRFDIITGQLRPAATQPVKP